MKWENTRFAAFNFLIFHSKSFPIINFPIFFLHSSIPLKMTSFPSLSPEDLLYLVSLTEESGRFDDMLAYFLTYLSETSSPLSLSACTSLSTAYKNTTSPIRTALRVLESVKLKGGGRAGEMYLERCERELREKCVEVGEVVDGKVRDRAGDVEARVLCLKLKADYLRYMCELSDCTAALKASCLIAYEVALTVAVNELPVTNPLRLGVVLNFSVFYYEIEKNARKAQEMAREAFNAAIVELENLPERDYKDTTMILQLLRDGVTLSVE